MLMLLLIPSVTREEVRIRTLTTLKQNCLFQGLRGLMSVLEGWMILRRLASQNQIVVPIDK